MNLLRRPLLPAPGVLFIIIGVLLTAVPGAAAFTIVVLDPGHGGVDPGAHWHGLYEKNLALDVARRVDTMLRDRGITTVMTRRTDRTVSLDERAAMANRFRDPLLVSIHFNASRVQDITGYETFYRSSQGRKIALAIQAGLKQKVPGRSRGVRHQDYAVLTRTRGPAVLIECGFISNKTEAGRSSTAAHRQKIAEGIVEGIVQAKKG